MGASEEVTQYKDYGKELNFDMNLLNCRDDDDELENKNKNDNVE